MERGRTSGAAPRGRDVLLEPHPNDRERVLAKFATIDLGTNTVLLLIANAEGKSPTIIADRAAITRIGQGVGEGGALAPEAVERTLAVLKTYGEEIRRAGVERVAAVGTAALRRASDAPAFVARASEVLGFPIEVISADREAELTYRSVAREFPVPNAIVIDIGGGSTEVIFGRGKEIVNKVSLDIGSVGLFERYVRSDPPSHAEWGKVLNAIEDALVDLPEISDDAVAFGVAGTVTSVAAMVLELPVYNRAKVHGMVLEHYHIANLGARILSMTAAERVKTYPALEDKRADVIPVGTRILQNFLEHYFLDDIHVADLGVRWGLLYELMGE